MGLTLKNTSFLLKCALPLCLAGCVSSYTVTVVNQIDTDRHGEIVEIPIAELKGLEPGRCMVKDAFGKEMPVQLTHDGLLIFPATVEAGGKATYQIVKGIPSKTDTLACGEFRPDRMDDIIWENEFSGYRTYGPALQAKGERAYGYDVFTKSVPHPVMKSRFDKALKGDDRLSFHEDHGDGMDVYGVGPTLGCGAPAISDGEELIYPWCWTSYEILDNGPLRFTLKATYGRADKGQGGQSGQAHAGQAHAGQGGQSEEVRIGQTGEAGQEKQGGKVGQKGQEGQSGEAEQADKEWPRETRILVCDAGSLLNRLSVRYESLDKESGKAAGGPNDEFGQREIKIATGLVMHKESRDAHRYGPTFTACMDLGDRKIGTHGEIYTGTVKPEGYGTTSVQLFPSPADNPGAPVGHVLGMDKYAPREAYTYYFGSGWSKAGINGLDEWVKMLEEFSAKKKSPLIVTISR